ncbi:hypothetical protein [Acuticoccus sp. I52.16.1]|uniref:hypothetical protein n=1 Tax=Acuticoccus sp. I52.16.1 TaxID=2928472 RepID=UPI001FD4E40C|nr:hypothetical protein [Acuticoccus sp. I52.16.1]UOM34190.1 hypothetical protein MRB58_20560 [Acuticoccus sp. I52.16.1]
MTSTDTDALRASLMETHPSHPICTPDTELLVEGYPRSSNTFTIDMLNVLAERSGGHRRTAHHTHSRRHVDLALGYGVPTVILVRRPLDAIVSYQVYSRRTVEACVADYVAFYDGLAARDGYIVGTFDEIVGDFNAFLARLNPLLTRPLPLSNDLAADAATAHQRDLARAERTHGEHAMRRVGVPDARRDPLKAEVREAVAQALAADPAPDRLYAEMLAKRG